ncbi:hypothetical protein [Ahniella affigens]|nr:hypothetical protein [Ahniella affigens]
MTTMYSHYFEQLIFKFRLSGVGGNDSPEWNQSSPFPPLSPRAAIQESSLLLERMLGPFEPASKPEVHECALAPIGVPPGNRWYYKVSWWVWPRDRIGDRTSVAVPVLMSGKSPEFEVFEYKDLEAAYRR